jgi:putative flippase GtrA
MCVSSASRTRRLSWPGNLNRLEFAAAGGRQELTVFVLRLLAVLSLLAIAIAFSLFLYTRNRRYLTWTWRILQFALVFVIAVMLLYVLERLVLVV